MFWSFISSRKTLTSCFLERFSWLIGSIFWHSGSKASIGLNLLISWLKLRVCHVCLRSVFISVHLRPRVLSAFCGGFSVSINHIKVHQIAPFVISEKCPELWIGDIRVHTQGVEVVGEIEASH